MIGCLLVLVLLDGCHHEGRAGDPVALASPKSQIEDLAPLGAERAPRVLFPRRTLPAHRAGHAANHTTGGDKDRGLPNVTGRLDALCVMYDLRSGQLWLNSVQRKEPRPFGFDDIAQIE